MKSAVEWLLEADQPAIRTTLTGLQGKSEKDTEVIQAKKAIPERGWARWDILARRNPEGYWENSERFYSPKYLSTNWMLLMLIRLRFDQERQAYSALASEEWMQRFSKEDGGFAMDGSKSSHLCTTGTQPGR